MRDVEAELGTFSADIERFDALREVCDALDKLGEMEADRLFWDEIPEATDPAGQLEKVRARVASFEEEIGGTLEKQQSLQGQINRCLDEMYILDEEVRDAYDREERRREEFVIEREMSPIPYRAAVMPWSREAESERRLRRAVLGTLFISFVFGALIPLINVPFPDRTSDSKTPGPTGQEGAAKARTGAEAGARTAAGAEAGTGRGRDKAGEEKTGTPDRRSQTPSPGTQTW